MTEETESSEETDLLRRHNELILAAAGEGIFGLDTQGRTTFVNPAAVDLSGFAREEMIGRRQHEMVHHTKPDGRPYPSEECPIHASFKDGEVHRVSNEVFWRKDGSSFPVEYVSTPIQEEGTVVGAVVAFRDITKRRQAEDALKESEARFRKIFDATYDAFFLVDMEQEKILDVNNESCRMLGYSRDELTALSVRDVHPNEMPMMREFASRVFERGKWQTQELTCRAKGGEFIPAELSATSIEFEGRPYMLVLAHDMRERRRAEARVRGLQADLQHVSRLSAMGEMASGLAHELNQPLTAIRNTFRPRAAC
ncbi:MAG: PAS domain S-box protein [Proteobacteria bacterium]|nr:PAS domain S-box protein [Pseudomonadota bacterium]